MANKKIKGITIEVGGDTTKLSKVLSEAEKDSNSLQKELIEVNKLLKLDPTNTELLAQKQKILKEAINATSQKLATLKDAEKQVQEQFEKGEVSEEQYRALQREIISTENALKDLEKQAQESNGSIASGVNNAVDKISEKTGTLAKKLTPVSAAASAVTAASVKSAISFEDAMAKVSTIADTTKVPLEELQSEILQLSDATGESASEIADAVYNAISAGQDTSDAVNFVSAATTLAKAGFTDTAAATDILTTALNAYGLEASEVTNISDMLITTQNLGKTTVNELASAMGKVIPTANSNNVSFSQLGAAYAQMTARGIATAESTTYLNGMLNELGKSGTKVDEIIREETGKGFSDLMAEGYSLADALDILNKSAEKSGKKFSDLWSSSEAGKAAIVLLGDSAEDFNNTLKSMEDSTGATEAAYKKLDTTSFTLSKSLNQIKNIAIDLGTALLQILNPAIQSISKLAGTLKERFSGLSDSQKEIISKIIMLVAVMAPALLAVSKGITLVKKVTASIGAVKKGFTALHKVIAAHPIAALITAIMALIAALIYLYNNCEEFREAVNKIFNTIKEFIIGFGTEIKDFFVSLGNAVKEFAVGFAGEIKDLFVNTWKTIKEFVTGFAEEIRDFFKGIWNAIKEFVTGFAGEIKDMFVSLWNAIKDFTTGFASEIKDLFVGMWNGLKEGAAATGQFFKDVFTTVCETIKGLFNTLGNFFSNWWSKIKDTFTALGVSIADAISGAVKNGINGIIYFIEDTINGAIGLINGAIKLINKIPGVEIGRIKELDLPKLAKGGVLTSGSAVVAEAGPELIQMVNGKTVVTPLTNTAKNTNVGDLRGDNKTEINLNIENFYNNRQQDIKELTEEVLQEAETIRARERRAYA